MWPTIIRPSYRKKWLKVLLYSGLTSYENVTALYNSQLVAFWIFGSRKWKKKNWRKTRSYVPWNFTSKWDYCFPFTDRLSIISRNWLRKSMHVQEDYKKALKVMKKSFCKLRWHYNCLRTHTVWNVGEQSFRTCKWQSKAIANNKTDRYFSFNMWWPLIYCLQFCDERRLS